MPRYLEKRRRVWYAVLDVPKALREHIGTKRFIKSLKTESLTDAERLVLPVVAKWKAKIEAVRTGSDGPLHDLAEEWREDFANASSIERELIYDDVLKEKVEKIGKDSPAQAKAFKLVVTNQTLRTDAHLEKWLSGLSNAPKTIDMKRTELQRLADKFPLTHQIDRRSVQRWAHELLHEKGYSTSSIRKTFSACRGYWNYLFLDGHLDREDQPFQDVIQRTSKAKVGLRRGEKSFEPEDVVKLLIEAKRNDDEVLFDLIQLAMWTGCRIEELCSLKLNSVKKDRLVIIDAKSEAGNREVPIHTQLVPIVERLRQLSTDGYLLTGLTFNKFGDRSNAIGKRFGRLKSGLGFGIEHVFHSIRKNVATLLENAHVPEGISSDILGHKKQTLTYGLYSGGAHFKNKQDALERLRYPTFPVSTEHCR